MLFTKGVYLPYIEARDFVRSLGLKNTREWVKYCKKDKPLNIPSNPDKIYKNDGWISSMDWLNTNNTIGRPKKYTVNDDYFKTWSHNMAYILGFWFADGCMTSRHSGRAKIFTISQHKSDKYLLESILEEMDSDNILTESRNLYTFVISSETICDDITKLGGKERKSLDVKFPNVPDEYLSDFVRGYFDGDGSIYYCKQNKSYISEFTSGSNDFMKGLYCVLRKNIPNLGGGLYTMSPKEYSLRFSKNDTIRLKKFMYKIPLNGKLVLKRKYDLFLKIPDDCPNYCYREFLNYNDSKSFVESLGFKNQRAWQGFCKDGKRPHNIPCRPNKVYKNSGWIDWPTWFGNKRKRKRSTKSAELIN